MKRIFWTDAVIATSFTFLLLYGLLQLTQLNMFNAFDSIGTALSDVELTDYVFSQLRKDPPLDTNIVVVNIGELSRRDVAKEIQIISKYKPRVIGLDSFWNCQGFPRDTVYCPQLKDTLGNLMLANVIKETGNLVLVTKLLETQALAATNIEDVYDSLEVSDSIFQVAAKAGGYASLETDAAFQDDVKTCRSFNPSMMVNGKRHLAFSVQMAMLNDSVKTKKFLERDNFSEIINYRGNIVDIFGQTNYHNVFYTLDVSDVMTENFLPGMIKDKIVIFGFLGKELGDPSWGDKFYTPLNLKMAGKANPDMFGVVVHANIVSMIMNEDYVDQMEPWMAVVMAIVLCVLNAALFSLIHARLEDWYDGITKLLQLIELVLLPIFMVMIFHFYAFKFDITLSLAGIALVGDSYEIYEGIVKKFINRIKNQPLFTKKSDNVLTP